MHHNLFFRIRLSNINDNLRCHRLGWDNKLSLKSTMLHSLKFRLSMWNGKGIIKRRMLQKVSINHCFHHLINFVISSTFSFVGTGVGGACWDR